MCCVLIVFVSLLQVASCKMRRYGTILLDLLSSVFLDHVRDVICGVQSDHRDFETSQQHNSTIVQGNNDKLS